MHIEEISTRGHERVLFGTDEASGLRSFIALHDTTLGPGLGGCRMWNYDTVQEALADVLQLSEGMTAKSALAGVPFGGGKAVIIGDSKTQKTPELLRAFGRFVESLHGTFFTGEDVGMSPQDMLIAAEETQYVSGLTVGRHASGDPSPVTAEGVFLCMKVAAGLRLGSEDLAGLRVAVQGLGHVGMALAERVHEARARLIAADVNPDATCVAADKLNAEIVAPENIVQAAAEIIAPCALGGVLTDATVAQLRARIVCGSANNQLAIPAHAQMLFERDVLYCPDYVVNSGGLIIIAREVLKIEDESWTEEKLNAAVDTFRDLISEAHEANCPPLEVANAMVRNILSGAKADPPRRASSM